MDAPEPNLMGRYCSRTLPVPEPSRLNEVFVDTALALRDVPPRSLPTRAASPDPEAVLDAVERMTPEQRGRLAELLGIPRRSELLWVPGTEGRYVAPAAGGA